MFLDFLVSLLSSISFLQVRRKDLHTGSYPVYTFAYNAYKKSLTPLLIKVGIVGTNAYNVGISAPNSGGDVSKNLRCAAPTRPSFKLELTRNSTLGVDWAA